MIKAFQADLYQLIHLNFFINTFPHCVSCVKLHMSQNASDKKFSTFLNEIYATEMHKIVIDLRFERKRLCVNITNKGSGVLTEESVHFFTVLNEMQLASNQIFHGVH